MRVRRSRQTQQRFRARPLLGNFNLTRSLTWALETLPQINPYGLNFALSKEPKNMSCELSAVVEIANAIVPVLKIVAVLKTIFYATSNRKKTIDQRCRAEAISRCSHTFMIVSVLVSTSIIRLATTATVQE
jgi:hypothetical protein